MFKDDLIASARKTLWVIKRMHKKRKNLHRIKESKKSKQNYMSLNIKDNRKKSKPSTRQKNEMENKEQLIFVGIHSRLVFQL